MRVAIVIPALNEEEGLPSVLASIPEALGAQIVVVDNGSTDRTAEVATEWGAVVLEERHRGYGSACLRAIAWLAVQEPPPAVVAILDADGSDDPSLLQDFVARIERGEADVVLSTRTHGGAEPGSLGAVQSLGNRVQTAVLNRRFGLQLTDMGPMRTIRFSALLGLEMSDRTWGWNVEMAARAAQGRLRIAEVPVPYAKRRTGESKISGSVVGAARAGGRILWALWRYCR